MNLGWRKLKKMVMENGSYKLVALFVTVILWVTILGRRDFVLNRKMRLEIIVPSPYVLVQPAPDHVEVKVSGPRSELRRFSLEPNRVVLDLSGVTAPGHQFVNITPDSLELPFGVRLISIQPSRIPIDIEMAKGSKYRKGTQ